jgi:SAM-dependent methyltransferase
VTNSRFGSAEAFSDSARAYQSTMAIALEPVAAEVVRRAGLRPGERVLDVGTGTGTAARMALGEERTVTGLDAAAGMLAIARDEVSGAEFIEADFTAIPLEDGSVDVVLAVHALLFASDRVGALREWLRVSAPGGRLSLSVPGPGAVTPTAIFSEIYDRHGVDWSRRDYPQLDELERWARDAGWEDVAVDADRTAVIPLADDAAFMTWLRVGRSLAGWTPERLDELGREMMAIAPRGADGGYRIPFGAQYLTASRAS